MPHRLRPPRLGRSARRSWLSPKPARGCSPSEELCRDGEPRTGRGWVTDGCTEPVPAFSEVPASLRTRMR